MCRPHPEGNAGWIEGRGEPPVVAAQSGTETLDPTVAGLDLRQRLLEIGNFDVQPGTRMGTCVASGPLEPTDALAVGFDDPVVGIEFGVCKGWLKSPAPHRAVETLEDLRRRCFNLPPNDLRHAGEYAIQAPAGATWSTEESGGGALPLAWAAARTAAATAGATRASKTLGTMTVGFSFSSPTTSAMARAAAQAGGDIRPDSSVDQGAPPVAGAADGIGVG